MNKLIHGEASRIISVLDESLYCVELLSFIPENFKADELTKLLDKKKNRLIIERINQLYSAEIRYGKALRTNSKDKIDTSARAIHEAARSLCRGLRNDTQAADILSQYVKNASREQYDEDGRIEESKEEYHKRLSEEKTDTFSLDDLLKALSDFKLTVMDTLSTTVEQEQAKVEFFNEMTLRMKHLESELEHVKLELKHESTKETDLASKKDTISKLWSAIQDVRSTCEREMSDITCHKSEKNAEMKVSFKEKHSDALKRFDRLSDQLVNECQQYQDTEESLRKKKMLAKRRQFDELKRLHKDESARLAVLKEHFRRIDRDLANEAEEERLIAEELAKIEALKQRDHDAAAAIQGLIRGVQARKYLKKKRKKGKGKKGAKKKGKKK